jgi:nucleolar GTP-binding protein
MRKALATVSNGSKNARKLANEFARNFGGCETKEQLLSLKKQAIGRISSILNRMVKELNYLEQCRKMLRTYPNIRTDFFTVAIAGFPHVGKSTLLNRLTGATAETNAYAFTTKSLNMGAIEYRHNTIQFIDTPGTLARPEKMNDIERQAYLAMKYAAHLIIYVYDLTETYPIEDQVRLENEVKMYGKEIVRYLSKTDILEQEKIDAFPKKALTTAEELIKITTQRFEEEFL